MIAKNDRIIVKKAKMPEKTAGGVILPSSANDNGKVKMNVGEVIAFGPGMRTAMNEFVSGYDGKIGDFVVWEHFGDFAISVLGPDYFGIRNEDVICVLSEEEKESITNYKVAVKVDTYVPPVEEEVTFDRDMICYKCGLAWTAYHKSRTEPNEPCPSCKSEDVSRDMSKDKPTMVTHMTPRFH